MKQSSLARRLLAGAAGLTIGATSAFAFAAPAQAKQDGDDAKVSHLPMPIMEVGLDGTATCDEETDTWQVEWTVTNTFPILQAVVSSISSSEVDGIAVNTVVPAGDSVSGTETFAGGTESATLDVELKWSWKWPPRDGEWYVVKKMNSATVELGECKPKPPEEPEEPKEPVPPAIVPFVTCDLLGFIIDNTQGDADTTVTLTPNEPATHGHASGFSYTLLDEEGNIEIVAEEGAGIHEVVGEANSESPAMVGPFPAGADLHTHAFEAFEGLEVTVDLTLDGEPVELEDNVVSWDDGIAAFGLECEDGGEGGELPSTGMSTALIAGGAVALLALGGGMFLVARRRRVTFTA